MLNMNRLKMGQLEFRRSDLYTLLYKYYILYTIYITYIYIYSIYNQSNKKDYG